MNDTVIKKKKKEKKNMAEMWNLSERAEHFF